MAPDPRILALIDGLMGKKKPYTRINETLPASAEGILERLVAAVASARKSGGKVDESFYRQAVLDRRIRPFTQADLSTENIKELAGAVAESEYRRQVARLTGVTVPPSSIAREDYPHGAVRGDVANAIGKAEWSLLPDSSAVVTDTYDFNNDEPTNLSTKDYLRTYFGNGPKAAALWLGRRALPAGVRGVPVSIRIPKDVVAPELRASTEQAKAYAAAFNAWSKEPAKR